MILTLQTIVSRNISPFHAVVLSITEVHGGHVWNVVPAEAGFQGTVRFFDQDDERLVHRRFVAEVEHTAEAYGIAADVDWDCIQVPLVGDEELSEAVAADVPPTRRSSDTSQHGGGGFRGVLGMRGPSGVRVHRLEWGTGVRRLAQSALRRRGWRDRARR